jgi:hypothetical protein
MSDQPDLVERLKAEGTDLTHAAADEILRLRAALYRAEAQIAVLNGRMPAADPQPEPPFTVREEPSNTPR